jgi:hypothetical protein
VNLYQIQSNYSQLLDIDIDSPEDQEAFLALLDELSGTLEEKAEGYCKVIASLDAEENAIIMEENRLEKRRKSIAGKSFTMRERLQEALTSMNVSKPLKAGLFTVSIRNCPESLSVTNEAALPERFFTRREVVDLDRACLKATLQSGAVVDGAELIRRKTLSIK